MEILIGYAALVKVGDYTHLVNAAGPINAQGFPLYDLPSQVSVPRHLQSLPRSLALIELKIAEDETQVPLLDPRGLALIAKNPDQKRDLLLGAATDCASWGEMPVAEMSHTDYLPFKDAQHQKIGWTEVQRQGGCDAFFASITMQRKVNDSSNLFHGYFVSHPLFYR